jgi:hypothetical protein
VFRFNVYCEYLGKGLNSSFLFFLCHSMSHFRILPSFIIQHNLRVHQLLLPFEGIIIVFVLLTEISVCLFVCNVSKLRSENLTCEMFPVRWNVIKPSCRRDAGSKVSHNTMSVTKRWLQEILMTRHVYDVTGRSALIPSMRYAFFTQSHNTKRVMSVQDPISASASILMKSNPGGTEASMIRCSWNMRHYVGLLTKIK